MRIFLFSLVVVSAPVAAFADDPADSRLPAPDPAQGDTYDGRKPESRAGKNAALAVPRFLLFPFRLILWGAEPPTRSGVEMEQRHHLLERIYYTFTSEDGQVGVRPTFEWMRGFRFSTGVHVFDHRLLGPGTRLDFDLAGGVDVAYVAVHARPTHLGRAAQFHLDLTFNRRNDFLFTGIGASPPLDAEHRETRYLANLFDLGARADLRAHRVLTFSLGGYFGWRRFGNGEGYWGDPSIDRVYCVRVSGGCVPGTVSDVLVPGFNQGTQFLRASAGVHVDLRDNLVRPTLGALFDAEGDYSHGLGSDDSSYFRVRGALSLHFNLWGNHSHVLVLRGVTQLVAPINDAPVPFSELSVLGGPNDLRGFRYQEFRDFSSLVATAEYRWPLLLWVDAALFVDYGGVFGRAYRDFGAARMEPDVGFSFRVHSRDRFFIRVQVAYGFDNGWQIYLAGENLP